MHNAYLRFKALVGILHLLHFLQIFQKYYILPGAGYYNRVLFTTLFFTKKGLKLIGVKPTRC
jgi:hypothetical protein